MGGRVEVDAPQSARADRSWYSIRNISASEAEILLYDEIGMWGITASDFIHDLQAIKASQINLRINSPGGEVFDAIAIYNALRRHSASVTTFVDGIAASAASFIAMAGDRVVMSPHAELFIHDAHGLTLGNATDMRQMADMLDKSSDNIAAIYAARAGGEVEEWRDKMRAETWFSDQEAVDAGLADEIDGQQVENRAPRAPRNEVPTPTVEPPVAEEPVAEPEPEPAVITPIPVDFGRLFQELVEQDDAIFALA